MSATERPMRRHEWEVTDPATIDRVLGRATVCRVAMVDDGEPYLVPLNCGWDGHRLLLHAAPAGRKIDILRANPRVWVEVEEDVQIVTGPRSEDCTATYVTVMGSGTVQFVADPSEKRQGLAIIMRQCHPGVPQEPLADDVVASVAVLAVIFDRLTCKAKGTTPRP